jgi:hypothetical protein
VHRRVRDLRVHAISPEALNKDRWTERCRESRPSVAEASESHGKVDTHTVSQVGA